MTPLEAATAAMDDGDSERLAFWGRFGATELHLLLEAEPEGDQAEPRLFPTGEGPTALAFDTEAGLAAFAGAGAAYLALTGRRLAELLGPEGIALGLNLGGAAETVLPPDALRWLAETEGARPEVVPETAPARVDPPGDLPEGLVRALDSRLAAATGLAEAAHLVAVEWQGGARGHLLVVTGALPEAEDALARAVGEALTFSGLDAATLDIAFRAPDDPVVARLARVALRFDLPQPAAPAKRAAPGSDPSKPPRLR